MYDSAISNDVVLEGEDGKEEVEAVGDVDSVATAEGMVCPTGGTST